MQILSKNLNWLYLILFLLTVTITVINLSVFWFVINLGALISLTILVVFNILEATKANLALKLEEHRLHTIIDNLRDGVIAYDQNFKVLVFNPAAEQIFNLKAEEVLEQSFTAKVKEGSSKRYRLLLSVLFPALAPTVIRRSEPGTYPQIVDISFDNPPVDLNVMTTKILDEKGEIFGFIKLVHDRTRELVLLKAKSSFITIASHQLRTPLTAASWALESLSKESLPKAQLDLAVSATAALNRLTKIVNDLLDVAKIEEGHFGYQFQPLNMITFLEEALRQAGPVADKYRVKLYLDKPAELPEITADPRKLSIVISNLLDNAIKYNISNGTVTVKVEKLKDKSYLLISIIDTGIGIPEENMSKIFAKFFRSENAAKIEVEGTGLGLYIAKNIIRRHGGAIWVASNLNRGSTFFFTLPTNPSLIPAKEIIYEE